MKRHLILLWLFLGMTAATAAFAIVLVVIEQRHQNDALSSVICHAEHLVHETPVSVRFTADEKRRAIRFYQNQITKAHLKPCE